MFPSRQVGTPVGAPPLFKDRFQILQILFAVLVVISAAVRTILLITQWHDLDPGVFLVLKEYGVGFFFDSITFCYAVIPFALYLILIPERFFSGRANRIIVHAGVFAVIYLLLFDGVAEYFFFKEFGTRFNFIAVDYLIYTREVVGNIRESYQLNKILLALFALSCGIFVAVKGRLDRALRVSHPLSRRFRAGLVYAAMPVLAFAFVDQSYKNISANQYDNEIAGNGIYDFVAAFRNNELDYDRFYPVRENGQALDRLRALLTAPGTKFRGSGDDLWRTVRGRGPERKLNLMVVVEESMSAEYLGVYGGPAGATPNLDRLGRESLLFTHFYATGTRTVRGLEAITLSAPPLPGVAIVKRPDNAGFSSWGSVMREKGYDTKYLYAGYGYFDNMSAFFSGNGFAIVDRSAFSADEITFANIWGVCDEDLFRKAIREADRSYGQQRPFFSMVMTTSNHRPYTYPDGKIDIPSKFGRAGGVKYADYALGRLIEEARTRPWFRDTVFVIVADHCAASAGSTALPVEHYEIPLLIYSPAYLPPTRIATVGSQIDLAPTVLGILNMNYTAAFLGRDLLAPGAQSSGRAFLSTYQKLAFLEGDRLVVISPLKQVQAYAYDGRKRTLVAVAPPEGTVNDALAYYQGANYLYKHRLNRLERR